MSEGPAIASDGVVVAPKIYTRQNTGCPDEGWLDERDPETKVTRRKYIGFELRDLRTGEVIARSKSLSTEEFVSAPVELKACPFCGRTDSLDPNDNFGGDRPYAVVCGLEDSQREACNFVGPEGATKTEAIAKWNTRPLEARS